MKKKFNSKKARVIKEKLFLSLISLIILLICVSFFININFFNSSDNFITYLLDESFNTNVKIKYQSMQSKFLSFLNDVKNPTSLLESNFGFIDESLVFNDVYEVDELEKMTAHIVDPNPIDITSPLVYIYNTHQLENYVDPTNMATGFVPNVMYASYLMKDKFIELGIPAIVEEADITAYMKNNNLAYSQAYNVSRIFLKEAIIEYPTLQLFIDVHRDALSKSASTVNINGLDCAKIMFVVGLEYDNYEYNYNYAINLNNKIKELYPTLTRGVLTKQGEGVNGIYNQDVTKPIILIELGGNENTIEEVNNTIELIADILIGEL